MQGDRNILMGKTTVETKQCVRIHVLDLCLLHDCMKSTRTMSIFTTQLQRQNEHGVSLFAKIIVSLSLYIDWTVKRQITQTLC